MKHTKLPQLELLTFIRTDAVLFDFAFRAKSYHVIEKMGLTRTTSIEILFDFSFSVIITTEVVPYSKDTFFKRVYLE